MPDLDQSCQESGYMDNLVYDAPAANPTEASEPSEPSELDPDGQSVMPDPPPPDTSYATAYDRFAERKAEEDNPVDEYGLAKPPVSWKQRLMEDALPPEAVQATDKPWYSDTRAFLAAPAAIAGFAMDNLSPFDTRGDWRMPLDIVGEMRDGEHDNAYERNRKAAEDGQPVPDSALYVPPQPVPCQADHSADEAGASGTSGC